MPLDKLSPESQKAWTDHAKAHNTIYLNPERCTMAARGMRIARAGKQAAEKDASRAAGAPVTPKKP